jgi:hypothetical protein
MKFDPDDESTWTQQGMKEWLAKALAESLKSFVGKRNTPTVREELEGALRSFADEIADPPRYEIVAWEPQPDGSVKYTIRDNRPGPDSLVLKALREQQQ